MPGTLDAVRLSSYRSDPEGGQLTHCSASVRSRTDRDSDARGGIVQAVANRRARGDTVAREGSPLRGRRRLGEMARLEETEVGQKRASISRALGLLSWLPTPLNEPSSRKVEFMATAGSCTTLLRSKLLIAMAESQDDLRNATEVEYSIAMIRFRNARMLLMELDETCEDGETAPSLRYFVLDEPVPTN